MRSNKVEYSTAAGAYYTMHDIKVHFCKPDFSIIKIVQYRFHIDNNEGELGIVYDIIIGCDLMVQLGLSEDLKYQFLQ